ncbi:unnamed protein product [Lymnaea stagnalis]|uniref:procollagen-proline 3-dioxygenase n=1 Tax=Lymnaea stagnalis TaxID=6523 RepID=A0AAV2HMT7_LYMST
MPSCKHLVILILIAAVNVFQLSQSIENEDSQLASKGGLNAEAETIVHKDVDIVEIDVKIDTTEQIEIKATGNAKAAADTILKEDDVTFDQLYAEGVKAYDNQLWYSCATKIERAIKDYRNYKNVLSDCRLDCSKGVRSSKLSNLTSKFAEFTTYVKFLTAADCFRRCKDESLTTHPRVTEKLENAFEKRKPYMYLQFCQFKLDRVKEAASAAYTYYLSNPDDVDIKHNIVFYRDKALVKESDFLDLEIKPYKEHYIRTLLAYGNKYWKGVINHAELCLEDYWKQDERCRADCEAQGRMKGNEFSTGVADLIITIITCQLNCEETLSVVYTDPIQFFLRDMFHYLQFAYYQTNELEKSAEATATFLTFNSSHAVMKENKELLKKKLGYTNDDFIPRKEAAEYLNRKREMQDIMDFINKNYKWPDINEEVDEDEFKDTLDRMEAAEAEHPNDWITRYEKLGMHLIAKSTDLNRPERFVTDGLLKEEQCEEMLILANKLRGATQGSALFDLKLAQQQLLENPEEDFEASLRQFIRAAEVVKHYTQSYLEPESALYFKYTSIVCWSQPEDSDVLKDCYPQEDGTCITFESMSDELFSDGFTTVTYLNNVDEDGDFLFLNENKGVDSSFGVKCGRTVGFNTGDRHAITVPKKGTKRCAMVFRYTTYRSDDEKDFKDLIVLLHRVDELRMGNAQKTSKEVLQNFKERGVKIVKNGEDLKGKERFVADGMASDEQCETLRNVALSLSLLGDGYGHLVSKPSFISPHTEHERYQGITVYRATKLMHQGLISPYGLKSFLELSENARLLVEKYFNLTKPLYFDYTHLVCRTAVDDSKYNRQDLSHPVHADNCNLQPDGSCTKDFPAFTQRDYSALLYLNSDFEGGEFFFAHANKSEQVSLRPKCGRLVGFNAGNFHGVKAVKSGQRCALALWFTLNPNFKELAHIQARKVLKQAEADLKTGNQHQEL